MSKRKVLSLVLVMVMVLALFAGCNGGTEKETTPAPGTSGGQATTALETTTEAPIKMNGYEFLWANAGGGFRGTGETANDEELRQIYAEIEEKFDCKITFVDLVSEDDGLDVLIPSIVSGTKVADFYKVRQSTWIPVAVMGGLRPLDSEEMLNAGLDLFNEDNFHQYYTQMTELNGHIWALDISGKYDRMAFGHVYAFNKRLVSEAGYEPDALFNAVRQGKWDYNMFLEIARKISRDNDGDGVNDVWGVALDCDGNEIWSNGTGPILQEKSTGRWYANLSDPKLIKSLEFMNSISGDPQVQIPLEGEAVPGRGGRRDIFYEGRAGFAGLYGPNFGEGGTFKMTDEVGLLPIPKGPDVDHYMINMVDVDTYVCPTSNDGWENGAKIMNEIGNRLHDIDEYREYILESLRGDEQSMEMLFDYLLPNALMNIAKCSYDMYQLTRYDMYDKIYKGNLTPAAAAEAYEGLIQAELNKVFRQS